MLAFARRIDDYQSMPKLQLAVFEDENSIRKLIRSILEDSPYEVTAEAATRRQAFEAVHAMHTGNLLVHAVLQDGNLDNLDNEPFSDARAIYNKMQELQLMTPVIGISSDKLAEEGVPIPKHLDITKWSLINDLIPALNSLEN